MTGMTAGDLIKQLEALPDEALSAPLEIDVPTGRYVVAAVNYETEIETPTTYIEGEWE